MIPDPNGMDRNDVTSFPKYSHKESYGKDNPELFPDKSITRKHGIVETVPLVVGPASGEGLPFSETTLDKYGGINDKLKSDGIQFNEVESIEKTLLIHRRDGTKILATYTEKCEIADMIALEKNVMKNDADLGLMISMEFSYDSKLFVVGRDLDLMKWDVFLRDGLVVEPSWFY